MKKKRFKNQPDQPENQPASSGAGRPASSSERSASASAPSTSGSSVKVRPARGSDASLFAENPEPVARAGGIPAILFGALVLVLYCADLFVMNNGGDAMGKSGSFPTNVYFPNRSFVEVQSKNPKSAGGEVLEKGQLVYGKSCIACHQPTGTGVAGQFPPLAGSEWVLANKPDRIIRIVLNGMQNPVKVGDKQYNGVMVPWRETFNDAEIAQVVSYVRNAWGNKASIVTEAEVKAIRAATATKTDAWDEGALLKIPVD